MCECMIFPDTVEEFMEAYKVVDTEQVYTNGTEFVPIFRMKQWFEHISAQPARKKGKWIDINGNDEILKCSECHYQLLGKKYHDIWMVVPYTFCRCQMEGE